MLGTLRRILTAVGLAGGLAVTGAAADPIRVNFVPISDGLPLFVAEDQGFFDKRGLDVELTAAPNPSVMISAIASGSAEVGHTVLIPVLAAWQAGIELSVIAGASAFPSVQPPAVGVLARKDSNIKSPKELEGKTVGVVGLESYHQAMVQRWMRENDSDYSKVRFVEVPFPQMQDLLTSGNVDAVVSVDPFYSKMIKEGAGYDFGDFVATMPDGAPIVIFVSSREWAEDHPEEVKGFRDALAEAAEFIKANDAEARKSFAKWTKLPEPVVATSRWGTFTSVVPAEGIQYWIDTMKDQGMLSSDVEGKDLIPSYFR
ncbi:ABC transporter substrate-binding protein [Aquibium sp. LZ166]|uniref:ABC transporter substrate-binding protein n=1 Tax=Aquibium pacificus TaxID=3153579 RepID=A0ABV3SJB4_9HYPH